MRAHRYPENMRRLWGTAWVYTLRHARADDHALYPLRPGPTGRAGARLTIAPIALLPVCRHQRASACIYSWPYAYPCTNLPWYLRKLHCSTLACPPQTLRTRTDRSGAATVCASLQLVPLDDAAALTSARTHASNAETHGAVPYVRGPRGSVHICVTGAEFSETACAYGAPGYQSVQLCSRPCSQS